MLNLKEIVDVNPGFTLLSTDVTLPTLANAVIDDIYVFYNPTSATVNRTLNTTDLSIHGMASGTVNNVTVKPGNTLMLRLSLVSSAPTTYAWVMVGGSTAAFAQLSNITSGNVYLFNGSATSDAGGNLTVYPVLPAGASIIGGFGFSGSDPSVIVNCSVNNTSSARFQLRYNTNLAIVSSHTFSYVLVCSKA